MSTSKRNYFTSQHKRRKIMAILTIEQLKAKLQDRRLEVVATATDLHYNTLLCIRDSKQTNVKYETLVKLSKYFERDCECECDNNN